MKKTTRKWFLRSRNFGGISALFLSLVTSSSAAPPPVHVDACKLVDLASVNAAAQAWFGFPVTLAQDSASGTGSGTCDFTTDKPRHIDISIFYAPSADASRYGLGQQPPPPNEIPVSGAGDRAVFDQDAGSAGRYKVENLSILKGHAVLVLCIMFDQKLAFVAKEKLADFADRKLVPRM